MATTSKGPTSFFRLPLMAKLLIDECMHTSLVELAQLAGHVTDHVNYLGLSGSKDWQLMKVIKEREYTLVTNNGSRLPGALQPGSFSCGTDSDRSQRPAPTAAGAVSGRAEACREKRLAEHCG